MNAADVKDSVNDLDNSVHRERQKEQDMCRTLSSNIPSASLHPVFSLSIKGDDKLSLSGTYTLHMTLTYQSSSPSLSPITFREPLLDDFISDDNWVLSHQTPSGSITIPRNDNPPCMVGIDIDEKDVVGESGNYMELAPGSAVEMELVFWRSNYDYEEEMRVGERYRLQYMGGRVAWWDWGAKEEHLQTKVFRFETSHEVRREIVVPASNAVEWTVVE